MGHNNVNITLRRRPDRFLKHILVYLKSSAKRELELNDKTRTLYTHPNLRGGINLLRRLKLKTTLDFIPI